MANGAVIGSPTFGAAKFGNGLTAVGDAAYLTADIAVTTVWTVEAWLKVASVGGIVLSSTADGSGGATIPFWIGNQTGGNLCLGSSFQTQADFSGGPNITDGAWHHVAVVSDGTNFSLYCDGARVTTSALNTAGLSWAGGSFTMDFGRYIASSSFGWPGAIDEVAVWRSAKYTGTTYTVPAAAYTGSESNLASLYHLESDATDALAPTAPVPTINAGNAAFVYSPFNWQVLSGKAKTINPGAYFRTIFAGTSIGLNFDTSGNTTNYPQLWVRVDHQAWVKFVLTAGSPVIPIASGLANRKHLLEVMYKSADNGQDRWNNPVSMLTFLGVTVDGSTVLTQPTRRSKNVLVYGDSMTEGALTEGPYGGSVQAIDVCSNLECYSNELACGLDAEVGVVGFGSSGLTLTGNGNVPPLPTSYNKMWSTAARSFSSPAPDLIILLEGFNDHGQDITTPYTAVLNGLVAAAPAAKILCLSPFDAQYNPTDHANHVAQIIAVLAALNNPNVVHGDVTTAYQQADTADGIHPFGYQSVGVIAPAILPLATALLYPSTGGGTIVVGRSYSFS